MHEELIDADEAKHQLALVERALEAEDPEQRQTALAAGMLAYGRRFMVVLAQLAERERGSESDRFQRLLDEATDLFTKWLGGKQITDRVDEDERRNVVLAEAAEPGLARLAAVAILKLPERHPLRDVDRARRLLESHLMTSRAEGDAEGELLTISDLLKYELEPLKRSLELIEEGLAKSAELENQNLDFEEDFRFGVAGYYAYRAIEAQDEDDEAAQRDWASRALAVLGPEPGGGGPLSEDATGLMLMVALALAVGNTEPEKAAELFGRIVDSPHAPPSRVSIAAMHEGRIRFRLGEYRRAAAVLDAHVASFEEAYLTAVTDADIASTASDFADVISNLAFARAYLDEWNLAVQTLERAKSLRFRHRAAMRGTEAGRDLLALEAQLHALTRGVPVEGRTASDRAADVLGQGVSPQVRLQEAYRQARPIITPDLLRSPSVKDIGAVLVPGEAAVLLGVHGRATMLAVVLPGDDHVPSGRWLLEEWPSRRWIELFAGTDEDGWVYALGAPEAGIDAGLALEKLLAGVDEALRRELAPFLEENCARRIVVVPHGWLHLIPFWATPTLAPYDVLMTPSAAQFVRARGRQTPALQGTALVVSNPIGDLPVSAAEAESVLPRLRRLGLTTSRLHGGEATEEAITSVLASGVSVFHFSGHGRSDMDQATRSALLLYPAVKKGAPESHDRLDGAVAAAGEWHEEGEELRWSEIPGVGRLYEGRALGSRILERTLEYSERGTLWAQYNGEDFVRMAELWTAGDIIVGEAFSGCGLAVLSACEAGTTQLDQANEYAGLPAAIELAGASTVVSTLWPIDDALTALHIDLLYEALAAQTGEIDVSHTLREVGERIRSLRGEEAVELVEDLRRRTTDPIGRIFLERFRNDLEHGAEYPFAGPYAWATFYVTGDGRIRVTSQ